jgi:asparagine synthase (glutamine-hydrolysing)
MCGIAGEVRASRHAAGASPGARATIAGMVAAMRHRGPDGEGYYDGSGVDGATLGMCRLAIVDVAGGEQPIATADGRFQIVYNGECYGVDPLRRELEGRGRVFRTRSDTEVVLNAVAELGPAGLHKLNGMFAFALWDRRERELLLVRDRLGLKPLYYWEDGERLVFSSTLAAIEQRRDFAGTIDPAAVELFLAHRFVAAPRTMYREVKKLPAGCLLRWRDGHATVEPWWDVPLGEPTRAVGIDEAAEQVEALLGDAAQKRLVSERPVGLCLSGGIDSGLLGHALRAHRTETFSLGFDDPSYDEAPAAARVASALGLPHHVLRAELDAEGDLDAVLAHFDEPIADPSGVALFQLSRLVSQHVTVVLSGTGGDELFGGYRRVLAGLLARGTRFLPGLRLLPRVLGRDERKLGWRGQLARLAATGGLGPLEAYRALLAPTTAERARALRRPEHVAALDGFEASSVFRGRFEHAEGRSLLTRLLYTDLKTVLADSYLMKEDRMTMAHSVEGRMPFLDYRLVELAFSLPDEHKVRGLTGKVLLRRLAATRLPAEIASAPKQGFEVPIAAWLRGPLAARARALTAADARVHEFLEPRAIATAVEEHVEGRADHGRLLWSLVTLESWLGRAKRGAEAAGAATGQRPTADGRRAAADGERPTADGERPTATGHRPTGGRRTADGRRLTLMVVGSSAGEGGAQRVTSTLLHHLDRARFAPALCTFKPSASFPLPDDVPVTVIGDPRAAPLAELARRRPWLAIELIARLRRHIAASRPDVILSNIDQVNAVTATALAGLRPRPRWVARVGSDPARQGRIAGAWAGRALAVADAIVVSSEALAGGVRARYPDVADRLRVVPNLTDFERIDALASAPPARTRDADIPLLVAVGRLSGEKRVDLMLEAIERVRRGRRVALWLCGTGPLADAVRAEIDRRGLAAEVAMLGFCDNPYALVRQADGYLLASDWEGLPNGLIEAQGLGVPAIATDCSFGPRDVVVDGETGYLVPPGDAAAMADAIERLLADPARRVAMGHAARARTRARFGVEVLIDAWQRVLEGP